MDTVMKTTLGLFFVILAGFTGSLGYNAFVDSAYRNTITGTYSYSCTITADSPLSNVTLFLPVPADTKGNSPIVSAFSSNSVNGVPEGWETTLYDTGKATMVKVVAPEIAPPAGTPASTPYTVTLTSETSIRSAIETKDPAGTGVIFRPVQNLAKTECSLEDAWTSSGCYIYTTSLYADYTAAADAAVTITSSVEGKNTWKVFEPRSNRYHTGITLTLRGAHHGWAVPAGTIAAGDGSYELPFGS